MMHRVRSSLLIAVFAFQTNSAQAQKPVRGTEDPPGLPFEQYLVKDRLGRQIKFYLGTEPQGIPAYLALFVPGTGAYSQFFVRQNGKTMVVHHEFHEICGDRARVLIVEKAGIPFGRMPEERGRMDNAPEEFRRDFALERWVEALRAALEAAATLPGIKSGRVLVVGHSDGSQVASRLAATSPLVTDVACLSGSSANQLSGFIDSARNQKLYPEGTPDEQISRLLDQWSDIRHYGDDPDRSWLGQPYPYWNSNLRNSTLDNLLSSNARVFVADPLDKGDYSKAYIDQIYGALLARGRDVTAVLVPDASHSFHYLKNPDRGDGWREILARVFQWFFLQGPGPVAGEH